MEEIGTLALKYKDFTKNSTLQFLYTKEIKEAFEILLMKTIKYINAKRSIYLSSKPNLRDKNCGAQVFR